MEKENQKNTIEQWIIYIGSFFISALFVMWLWNWVGVSVFHFNNINYLESMGILALSNLLLKNSSTKLTK